MPAVSNLMPSEPAQGDWHTTEKKNQRKETRTENQSNQHATLW